MICKVCGRVIHNEEANFCEYCGASFREINQTVTVDSQPLSYNQNQQQTNQSTIQAQMNFAQAEDQEKPITFWHWLGLMLIPFIPIVGGIGYIVMLFVYAFGNGASKTKKNWARATLVALLVAIIFLAMLVSSAMDNLAASGMTLNDFVNNSNTYFMK